MIEPRKRVPTAVLTPFMNADQLARLGPQADVWQYCPNEPRCPHMVWVHDVSGDEEDPRPICCADGCRCGQPDAQAGQ